MRVGGVLTIALVMSILAGCGDQGAGTTRDPSGVTGWVHLGPQCPVQTESDPCDDNPAPGSRVTERTSSRPTLACRASRCTYKSPPAPTPRSTFPATQGFADTGRQINSKPASSTPLNVPRPRARNTRRVGAGPHIPQGVAHVGGFAGWAIPPLRSARWRVSATDSHPSRMWRGALTGKEKSLRRGRALSDPGEMADHVHLS